MTAQFSFSWTRCHGNQRSEVSFCFSYCHWYQMMSTFNGGSGNSTRGPSKVLNAFRTLFSLCTQFCKDVPCFVLFFFSLHKVKTSKRILLSNKLCPYVTTTLSLVQNNSKSLCVSASCWPARNHRCSSAQTHATQPTHKAGSTFHWKSEAESTAGTKVQIWRCSSIISFIKRVWRSDWIHVGHGSVVGLGDHGNEHWDP
jgi:hypothetical protein